jgi:hypothetical protein
MEEEQLKHICTSFINYLNKRWKKLQL